MNQPDYIGKPFECPICVHTFLTKSKRKSSGYCQKCDKVQVNAFSDGHKTVTGVLHRYQYSSWCAVIL